MIPIRCFHCGKPIAHLWDEYKKLVEKGENKKDALDKLGLERYCCRSMFLTHVSLIKKIGQFKR